MYVGGAFKKRYFSRKFKQNSGKIKRTAERERGALNKVWTFIMTTSFYLLYKRDNMTFSLILDIIYFFSLTLRQHLILQHYKNHNEKNKQPFGKSLLKL